MRWETKKNCVTWFFAIFALLWWCGTTLTVFLRYGCNNFNYIGQVSFARCCNIFRLDTMGIDHEANILPATVWEFHRS